MSERRYNEAEVAAIFQRASETQQPGEPNPLPSGEGMTLAQLQDIGREVGISAEEVAQAANALDRVGRTTSRRFLGLPVGVGRTIDLGRNLSDEEWERFVVDLRETFDARGTLRSEGSLRQWTNGNLQALLEPTATGHRIRLRTLKGNARTMMTAGIAMVGIATVEFIVAMLQGGDQGVASSLGILAVMGIGIIGLGAVRVPGWARLRQRQMEEIAARIAAVANARPPLDRRLGDPNA